MIVIPKTAINISLDYSGYIAGANDGIVTVQGKPASRKIWLLNAQTMVVEQVITSLRNGHYMFLGLDPSRKYMVIVRDFEPDGIKWTGEAAVWDYVEPANDLDITALQSLWSSWQTV